MHQLENRYTQPEILPKREVTMKPNGKVLPTADVQMDAYRGYEGLPPLAGLLTMRDATTKGLTVDESVERLKRLHWGLKRLHFALIAHIPAMPIYELKMAFSLHAFYCSEHVGEFAKRVREMRQPPYGLEVAPDAMLDAFFDEVLCAPSTAALLLGFYEKALPAIIRGLKNLMADCNRMFEHPSYRICRFTLLEIEEAQQYGTVARLVKDADRAGLEEWLATLDRMLAAAGDLDGREAKSGETVERHFSATPYRYDPVPRRDERFIDSYNMGVNAEAMLFDPDVPALPKTIMLYFKRMREIDVPEMMSSIIVEESGKPWGYYRDMTRQLWDEARHAMMGEVGFVSLGIDWTKIPFNFTWSLGLNTILTAKERHGVLFTIEQGLMPRRGGKENEWEIGVATADPLTARIQDYDWADEVLHAKIGKDWFVPQIGTQVEAMAFGDRVWNKVLVDWKKWQDDGLTEHRNWWPEVYRAACKHWGVEPDAKLLGYNKTYENSRPDLKEVAAG